MDKVENQFQNYIDVKNYQLGTFYRNGKNIDCVANENYRTKRLQARKVSVSRWTENHQTYRVVDSDRGTDDYNQVWYDSGKKLNRLQITMRLKMWDDYPYTTEMDDIRVVDLCWIEGEDNPPPFAFSDMVLRPFVCYLPKDGKENEPNPYRFAPSVEDIEVDYHADSLLHIVPHEHCRKVSLDKKTWQLPKF